jgi:hypothetical protein
MFYHLKLKPAYIILQLYKIEFVCVCVCVCVMFVKCSRTDAPICTKLGMLVPRNQEQISERPKLRKRVLGSEPGEGGLCILETKAR